MPLPDNQKTHFEIAVAGLMSSGGAGTVNCVNVFHYRRTAVVSALSKGALDNVFNANIIAPLLLALNNRYTQVHNAIRSLDDPTDSVTFFPHAGVGAVAGDGMGSIESVYILLRTALRGKRYRGNKKFGPLSEADTTAPNEDILNAAAIARWTAVMTAMGTPLVDANGNTWVLEIISRRPPADYTVSPAVVVANDVNALLLNKRIGRLRRRERASQY